MRTPYAGDEKSGYCGYGTMTDGEVLAAMEMSAKEGCQLLAHCNGDAAAEQFLRCLEAAVEKYPVMRTLRRYNPRAAHRQRPACKSCRAFGNGLVFLGACLPLG